MTDVGIKRSNNQDSFLIVKLSDDKLLAVVCDGMGGAKGGLEASSTAAGTFVMAVKELLSETSGEGNDSVVSYSDILKSAAERANEVVFNMAQENPELEGMGTTLVAVLTTKECIYAVNIGDSRLYSLRENKIIQVTHDHSYVQFLVDSGKITNEEARESVNRNIITRAVGTELYVESDIFEIPVQAGVLVLTTDGLTNHVEPEEILSAVGTSASSEEYLADAAQSLIELAKKRGGSDNITLILISL